MADELCATVQAALREADELPADAEVTEVDRVSGGWSRASYVAVARTGAGQRRYVVRANPPGGLLDTSLEAEYQVYLALRDSPIPVPVPYFLCEQSDNVFGGPYFIMSYVEGDSPNVFRKDDRRRLEDDWNGRRGVAEDTARYLALIHNFSEETLDASVPRTSFEQLVEHWSSVYHEAALVRDPVLEAAIGWLRRNPPGEGPVGLVHGDYRPGNMLIADGRVSAILDWELTHFGDVRFDLGYLSLDRVAGQHLLDRNALFGGVAEREWFFQRYTAALGAPIDLDGVRSFAVLSIVMLTAIMLTGVRAYAEGETSDPRMAWNHYSLAGLRREAVELMGW